MSIVGVVGVGRMGLPICTRLTESGWDVLATDRDGTRRGDIETLGATWEDSPDRVAQASSTLITVLPGSPELRELMSDLLPVISRRPGTWIDLTSTSPQVSAELRAAAGQLDCLDAPMGGGPDEARAGTLELFVGATTESLARHEALLKTLGRINHVGGPGAGTVVKHLVNLLWFGQAMATGEALLLAQRAGLDLSAVQSALRQSAADSSFLRRDLPALLDGDYLTDFGLDRCCEELEAVTDLARDLEVPFELSSLVRDLHDQALAHFGPRDGELLGVAMLEDRAGESLGETER